MAPFVERTGADNPLDDFTFMPDGIPAFADVDGDGDEDIIVLEGNTLNYYQNENDRPEFTRQPDSNNPFKDIENPEIPPVLADIDGDGDLDAILGSAAGTLRYYQNTGNAANPVFTPQTDANDPFEGIDVGENGVPAFADIDGDGDLDALIGSQSGTLHYYQNTGSATNPIFTLQTGANNPFEGINAGENVVPKFADVDGDGDVDLITGNGQDDALYHENIGNAKKPKFATPKTGTDNPFAAFSGLNQGSSDVLFKDADGDGDLDAILATENQRLQYYENTGKVLAPPTLTAEKKTKDSTPTFTGTAVADSLVIIFNEDMPMGFAIADDQGNWSFTPATELNEGLHNITAQVKDEDNNSSPFSSPFQIVIEAGGAGIVPDESVMTAIPNAKAVELTQLGQANTVQLDLEQVGVSNISELLIFTIDDVTGTNKTQIASFSILEGKLSGYDPKLVLDSDLMADGKLLQFEIVENGQTRVAEPVSLDPTLVSLNFGSGTLLNLFFDTELSTTNLLVGDAEAVDLTSQTGPMDIVFKVYREAAFNNTVGFYTTDFADGGILDPITGDKLMPGQAGYKEAAVANQLETTLSGSNGALSEFSATIEGGGFLGTFLVANGSDPMSGTVYFSHAGANPNGNDHAKLLGSNTFGFEDMAGLGDGDFNDVVVQFSVV